MTLLCFFSCDTQTKELKKQAIGKDIFEFCDSQDYGSFKTIPLQSRTTGTNGKFWVTYYPDVDITLKSNKSTDKIVDAKYGRGGL